MSHYKPGRPRGVACMDPRDTVGRICKEDHYTSLLLHTKYESSGPCGFGEDFFYVSPIVSLWELSVAIETTVLIQSVLKPNTINPPTRWFASNLIKIGQLASETFIFEIVDADTGHLPVL